MEYRKIITILGVNKDVIDSEEEYMQKVRRLLLGQDFLRLGHCIQSRQWHLVLSNCARLKQHCGELGITCFDVYLQAVREAARHQSVNEALQMMGRITAKRVQLRNLLAEENGTCDM